MTKGMELSGAPQVPVIRGAEIALPDDVDETYGVPADVAQQVAAQVLAALEQHAIDPDTVVFSGYDDSGEEGHERKAEGEFAHADGTGRHEYFFGDIADLADGEEGPLAYAASGERPVLGAYSVEALTELGFDGSGVTATPEDVLAAQVLQFLPTYTRSEEY